MKTLSALLSQTEAVVSKAIVDLEGDAESAVTDLKNDLALVYNKATTVLNEGGLKEDEAYLIGYLQSFIKAVKNKFETVLEPIGLTEKTSVQPEAPTIAPVDLYGEKLAPVIVNTAEPNTPEHEASEAVIEKMTAPQLDDANGIPQEESTDASNEKSVEESTDESDTTEEEATEENTAPTPAEGTIEGQNDSTVYPPRNMGNEA